MSGGDQTPTLTVTTRAAEPDDVVDLTAWAQRYVALVIQVDAEDRAARARKAAA